MRQKNEHQTNGGPGTYLDTEIITNEKRLSKKTGLSQIAQKQPDFWTFEKCLENNVAYLSECTWLYQGFAFSNVLFLHSLLTKHWKGDDGPIQYEKEQESKHFV